MISMESDSPGSRESSTTIDLVRRAQHGEVHALSDLFERYFPRVRQFVRRKLGARLRQRVESIDIVQDTFAQAAKAFDSFRPHDRRSLINYLCKIAENKIREELRYHWAQRRTPDREVALEGRDGTGPSKPQNDETPSQILARNDVLQAVRESIDALPENSRESIILSCFCELTFAEIAKQTNRPTSDAARMFHRDTAIKGLAQQLRQRGVSSVDQLS